MMFNKILPIALLSTTALFGCDMMGSLWQDDDNNQILFPKEDYTIVKTANYNSCANPSECLIVRGAPVVGNKKPTIYNSSYVAVFPVPRPIKRDIGFVSARDLYSNLGSSDSQVRSDTLSVMDEILNDDAKNYQHEQIQGMLEDYINDLTKKEKYNINEYDIAKDIYMNHFPKENDKLNRPNWDKVKNKDFSDLDLSTPSVIKDAENNKNTGDNKNNESSKDRSKILEKSIVKNQDENKNSSIITTKVKENLDDKSLKTIEKIDIIKKVETVENIEHIENIKHIENVEKVDELSNIPEFDFSDPKNNSLSEPTELELQMDLNKTLSEQKKQEDAIIDNDLSMIPTAEELLDWSCTQNMCATRLSESGNDIKALIDASKVVLKDKTQTITPRLYAICSMKCASQADKKFEPEVIEFLATYLRRRAPWIIPAKGEIEPQIKSVRPDVQASLFVVGARDRMKNLGFDINLIGTDLRGADLSFANLYNTNLSFSNLAAANIEGAYGLLDWNKVYLATIDETTKIPPSIFAGFVVVKQPNLPVLPAGSYKVTTDDWIFWNATPVK